MSNLDRTTPIHALPNLGGQSNLPGLRRLWLIEARHVLGLVDPRMVPGALEVGWYLPDMGLTLSDEAQIQDWRFRANQGQYEEKPIQTMQGIAYAQSLRVVLPRDSPQTTLTCYRMTGRKWLAIYSDSNGMVRLVGTPKQPLRFGHLLSIGKNDRVLTFTGDTKLPALYLTPTDDALFSAFMMYQTDFSRL